MSLVFLKIGYLLHQKLYGVLFPVPLKWDINKECLTAESNPSRLWRWKLIVYIGAGLLANVGGSLLLIRNFYFANDPLPPAQVITCIIAVIGVVTTFMNHVFMCSRYELAEGMNSLLKTVAEMQSAQSKSDVFLLGKIFVTAKHLNFLLTGG